MTSTQRYIGLAALGLILTCGAAYLALHTGKQEVSPESQSHLARAVASAVDRQSQAGLSSLYRDRHGKPVWLDANGTSSDARAVMALLQTADRQGLMPARYKVGIIPTANTDDAARAAFELSLSRAAIAYAHDMEFGAFEPGKLFSDVSLPKRQDDTVAQIKEAAGRDAIAAYLVSLEPKVAEYAILKAALLRYRGAAIHPWAPLATADKAALVQRLQTEGFTAPHPTDALKAFQTANGLDATGRLDDKSLASLNVSPRDRMEQIAVNLERWRWLPRDLGRQHIMVNVPSASLVLVKDGIAAVTSRVVVGAPDKPTPILAANAIAVTINPVWHVPKSIVDKEIKPKLDANPDYLEAKNMAVADDGGIIQRPGPSNALGVAKFEMPNGFAVYLHDTPSKRAFLSDERALSHGCVRVERIQTLAETVLELTDEEMAQKIASGETSRQPLKHVIPVYIQYWTVIPGPQGAIGFRNDVYGRDAKMIAVLRGNSQRFAAR